MIRKSEIVDAVNSLNHDLLSLSIKVDRLSSEVDKLKKEVNKSKQQPRDKSGKFMKKV